MNQYVRAVRHLHPKLGYERRLRKALTLTLGGSMLVLLGACGGVSSLTKEAIGAE
jgi:hypothetical protein